jgi:tagaturonate reductase
VSKPEVPVLNGELFSSLGGGPAATSPSALPERVLQFGEGNFLRAFVDWMLERMNQQGLFGGRALLVQPIADGRAEAINRQSGLYTVLLRGVENGELVETREVVSSVSRCLDPYSEYDAFIQSAAQPELRFIVSNTTEAGIRVDPEDRFDARPARSFPGKLTQWLYARFWHFAGDPAYGVVVLPCELIERNGDALLRAVEETARAWQLPAEFIAWLRQGSVFTNTLVDRIVTGYPAAEAPRLEQELGYRDELLVAAERFHCWVIESPRPLEKELPLAAAGLNVIWTQDITPYRERKVRILNGAHTLLAPAAFLAGKSTVRESMEDPLFRRYVERALSDEILGTLKLPPAEVSSFAASVLERFVNPSIQHQLISITLNSVSKYKARLLGSLVDNHAKASRVTPRLAFALAALFAFYRGRELANGALHSERSAGEPYQIKDDAHVLEYFRDTWAAAPSGPCSATFCADMVAATLAREDFWGVLPGPLASELSQAVASHLHAIATHGTRVALERLEAGMA